ncbi:MAG TPA: dipeptidase [Acetobacteraceae bacterium]|nr:dipeptidase [Acetobacteraceae bacterium]
MDTHLPSPALDKVLAHIGTTRGEAHARLFEFLRIESISAQPAHAVDCRRAASWVAEHLRGSGFSARILETGGHPVVVADHPGTGPGPHLLYYGHYDVQPAEPLELWTSPAFEPTLVEGKHGPKIVARGAVDDKGQVSMWLEAFRAWHDTAGGVPVPITVLIEGEEEVGTANLLPFLRENKALLRADAAVISDTGMWDIDTPALTTRLRGIVYTEVRLQAANRDLHSGIYGGSALNPINALTRILGSLHDAEGRVQLEGFYDGVEALTAAEAAQWDSLHFDEAAVLGGIGLSVPVGERGLSGLTRLWARPTADINGIWGGYQGDGPKTVIAAEAGAKVSFRLVPGQDPEKIFAAFEHFVRARTPADARVTVKKFSADPAITVPVESNLVHAAEAALQEEYGRQPVRIGCGGSIPVVEAFHSILGLDSLLMGFGLEDDQVHSPNEKFEVRCLDHGTRVHARLLANLGS